MASEEDFDEFRSIMRVLLFIIASIAIFINSALIYVIWWSRRLLHQPMFIFMVCFAISDIIRSFTMIFTGAMMYFPFEFYTCKFMYSMFAIENSFKPILLSAVFVILTVRPLISKRNSIITIAMILIGSIILAFPECYFSELVPYIDGTMCKNWQYQKVLAMLKVLIEIASPLMLIIAYFTIKYLEHPWKMYIQISKMQQMILIVVTTNTILWTPTLIGLADLHFGRFLTPHDIESESYFIYYILLHSSSQLANITICIMPFLLYFMNQEFKLAVNKILRRGDDTNFRDELIANIECDYLSPQ